MNYLIVLIPIIIACSPPMKPDLKLHFGDIVIIKEGFYRGCRGEAKSPNNMAGCYNIELEYRCDRTEICLDYDKPEQWELKK